MWIPLTIDIQCMMNIPEAFTNISMHSNSIVPYLSAPAFGRYQNLAPQSITEKNPIEYELDEICNNPYVGGLLHPTMFSYLITIYSC